MSRKESGSNVVALPNHQADAAGEGSTSTSPPSTSAQPSEWDLANEVIDMHTLQTKVTIPRNEDSKSVVEALMFQGSTFVRPVTRSVQASFTEEEFTKVICKLHKNLPFRFLTHLVIIRRDPKDAHNRLFGVVLLPLLVLHYARLPHGLRVLTVVINFPLKRVLDTAALAASGVCAGTHQGRPRTRITARKRQRE
ncbi:hypothetical protein CPC08DRAFT_765425 [Agrocybe pediades]|nr:hypothetical protein CPC08DRAFT_765425 [Agrocybe pediades]